MGHLSDNTIATAGIIKECQRLLKTLINEQSWEELENETICIKIGKIGQNFPKGKIAVDMIRAAGNLLAKREEEIENIIKTEVNQAK